VAVTVEPEAPICVVIVHLVSEVGEWGGRERGQGKKEDREEYSLAGTETRESLPHETKGRGRETSTLL